jgi:hypothetical protein
MLPSLDGLIMEVLRCAKDHANNLKTDSFQGLSIYNIEKSLQYFGRSFFSPLNVHTQLMSLVDRELVRVHSIKYRHGKFNHTRYTI